MWLLTHDSRLVSSFWSVRSYVNNYKVEFQHLRSALAKESIVSCVALFLIPTLFLASSKISVLKLFLVEITSASKLRPLLLEEITDSFTVLSHVSLAGHPKTCQESQDWCSLSLYVYRQKVQSEMYVNRSPILTLIPFTVSMPGDEAVLVQLSGDDITSFIFMFRFSGQKGTPSETNF